VFWNTVSIDSYRRFGGAENEDVSDRKWYLPVYSSKVFLNHRGAWNLTVAWVGYQITKIWTSI